MLNKKRGEGTEKFGPGKIPEEPMYSDLRELARSKKLPVILAMMCFLAAIWMEFGPQSQPGTEELREGQIISLTASTNAEREKACDLFRQAFTKGNINASIALSHCLPITYPNTSDIRIIRYAILWQAVEQNPLDATLHEHLESIQAVAKEVDVAKKIDIQALMAGDIKQDNIYALKGFNK